MVDFLNRATVDIQSTEGRTLSGMAMPWDKVSMVRDLIRGRVTPPYPEAFAPVSTDKTRAEHPNFPVFVGHDPGSEPIGIVNFRRSDAEGGLMFDAPLSKTRRADDQLELAQDGAMRSVSIQFRPVQAVKRALGSTPGVTYRTEVGLRHLALAPTGYGQYDDARVTSIRTEIEEIEEMDEDAQRAELARVARQAKIVDLGARSRALDLSMRVDLERAAVGIGDPIMKSDVQLTLKVIVLKVTGKSTADQRNKAMVKVQQALAAAGGIHLI